MNLPQAHGNKTRRIFFLLQPLKGRRGNLWSSGSGAGQCVDFVRLLYIIRLYLSPIYRRRRGIEYNYMLCIIALSCFFSGAFQARRWRLECLILFCSCVWIETVVLKKQHCESRLDCKKCDRKKQQKG
jgi:hypothetical protein